VSDNTDLIPSKLTQAVELLTCSRKVAGSKRDSDSSHPDGGAFVLLSVTHNMCRERKSNWATTSSLRNITDVYFNCFHRHSIQTRCFKSGLLSSSGELQF
jgi:hypothetical protein